MYMVVGMTIEQIDSGKVMILLKNSDMKDFALEYSSLSFSDPHSRRILTRLLSLACSKTGVSAKNKKMFVEALPHKNGCLILLTLKEKHGLLSVDDYEVTDEQIGAAVSGVGSTENREAAWRIAGEALTLLKNENSAFPISLRPGETTLILFSNSAASRVGAGELAKKLLEEENLIPEGAEINVLVSTKDNEEECVRAALEADHLVLVHRMNTAADIDAAIGSGFSAAVFDRIISERHAAGGQAVLISCHLPYDAVRFPDADAILLTYGASLMEEVPPETGRGSACMPNLPAGLLACFGKGEIKGQLPVKLPEEIEK